MKRKNDGTLYEKENDKVLRSFGSSSNFTKLIPFCPCP